tara:strand:+ start:10596 stop:12671 length:2076 start_codon:yes stop_codon:yes gene_type:complete
MKSNKYQIILTSDGGGGHKAAAEALKQFADINNDKTILINIIKDHWLLPWKNFWAIDQVAINGWNEAQKSGNVSISKFLASLHFLTYFSRGNVKENLVKLIAEKEVDFQNADKIEVHNTGLLCICSMVSAVAEYNRDVDFHNEHNPNTFKKKIKFINHFTDLPAKGADGHKWTNFAYEMDALDPKDMNDALFELRTPNPVLSDEEIKFIKGSTEKEKQERYHEFMKEVYKTLYLNLPKDESGQDILRVKFTDGPIRPAFLHYKETPAKRSNLLKLNFTNEQEYNGLKAQLGNILSEYYSDNGDNYAHMRLDNESNKADIITIMLGSQADIDGSLSIVDSEIELSKQSPEKPKYIFIFCGPNNSDNELYKQALAKSDLSKDSNVKIIPLSSQGANTIAHLYSTADVVNIRPGGISSMEAKLVVKKDLIVYASLSPMQRMIDSLLMRSKSDLEKIHSNATEEDMNAGFIPWEITNARGIGQNTGINVSKVNQYSYRLTRSLNVKKDEILLLLQNEQYSDAISILKNLDEDLCKHIVLDNRPNLRKIAALSLLLKHLDSIKNNYSKIKVDSEKPEEYQEIINNLINNINENEKLLKNNPFDDQSEQRISAIYSCIMDTSNEIFEKLERDITAKNSESILKMLASVIRSIMAHIPIVRIFIADSLEAKYYALSENIADINKEANFSQKEFVQMRA